MFWKVVLSMENKESMNIPIPNEIVSPSIYTIEEVKDVEKHTKKVSAELNKAEKAFSNVSCELAYLYDNDRYKALDTSLTFEEFAKQRFGFKKTQSYSLVNLAKRFGICSENGEYQIDSRYKEFGHTKLIQMTGLTDEQIAENITSNLTVAEIKKVVKSLKADSITDNYTDSENIVDSDTDNISDNETDSKIVDSESLEHNTQTLVSYKDFNSFESDLQNALNLVSNAFKKGNALRVSISYEW